MHKPTKRCGTWTLAPICAVGIVTLGGCGGTPAPAAGGQPVPSVVRQDALRAVPDASPLRKALQIATVQEQSVQRPIAVPGVIEADPARLMKVVPPVSGRIDTLYKRLGDTVKVGDPLFSLDSADLAQAWSDAGKAQAALALAQHNLERQQELSRAEIAARKDLQQAESDQAQAAKRSAPGRASRNSAPHGARAAAVGTR